MKKTTYAIPIQTPLKRRKKKKKNNVFVEFDQYVVGVYP